jgi:hypothetical protein
VSRAAAAGQSDALTFGIFRRRLGACVRLMFRGRRGVRGLRVINRLIDLYYLKRPDRTLGRSDARTLKRSLFTNMPIESLYLLHLPFINNSLSITLLSLAHSQLFRFKYDRQSFDRAFVGPSFLSHISQTQQYIAFHRRVLT